MNSIAKQKNDVVSVFEKPDWRGQGSVYGERDRRLDVKYTACAALKMCEVPDLMVLGEVLVAA
ncbi:hypothetical protein NKJ26_17015 [Mesorhizobium sp. M0152]|uniref:hypothetical protein n=1 Tax=unclassified Mesorhizobium TaxID=325217 RepID=UPI0033361C66